MHYINLTYMKFSLLSRGFKQTPIGLQIAVIPKEEPVDSPISDYSGENTSDADLAALEVCLEKKYSISPECISSKPLERKKWINEVTSTQPTLNISSDKINDMDEEKEIEIDKEVETVLQSGTIVESLRTTENLNFVSTESHCIKGN